DVVRLLGGQIEAVLVDDPLGVLDPVLPGLGRDRVVDALPQGIVKRLVGQGGELLPIFCALDHPAHGAGHSTFRTDLAGPVRLRCGTWVAFASPSSRWSTCSVVETMHRVSRT